MTDSTTRPTDRRVIPVVVIDDATDAVPLGEALIDGGLPIAEVTLRTPQAIEAIQAMARLDDLLVGAGSVCNAADVDRAVGAGARFVVSPGLSAAVVERCRTLGVEVIPGVATPSEMMQALDLGLDLVKLFPAGLLGGPPAIRDLGAPFPSLRFVPTGGVSAANLGDYLALPAVAAVGGSWMVARDLVRDGRFDDIRAATAVAVAAAAAVAA